VYVGKATALTLDLAGPLAHFLVCAAIWVYAGNYCSELLHAGGLAGCVEWDVR
jgi:hypothetical protein